MTKSRNIGRGGARENAGRPRKVKLPLPAPEAVGVDPASVDPRRVLAGIAIDPNLPASARVAAAKALLKPEAPEDAERARQTDLSRRALEIMNRRPN